MHHSLSETLMKTCVGTLRFCWNASSETSKETDNSHSAIHQEPLDGGSCCQAPCHHSVLDFKWTLRLVANSATAEALAQMVISISAEWILTVDLYQFRMYAILRLIGLTIICKLQVIFYKLMCKKCERELNLSKELSAKTFSFHFFYSLDRQIHLKWCQDTCLGE